jgi:hypothetical protein
MPRELLKGLCMTGACEWFGQWRSIGSTHVGRFFPVWDWHMEAKQAGLDVTLWLGFVTGSPSARWEIFVRLVSLHGGFFADQEGAVFHEYLSISVLLLSGAFELQ